ncbi:MAG: hypothetical protein H7Z18_11670 [Methylophilaceae bacterium]|nr:hypothetical protein [Methylophilaceae bacterium]
MNKKLNIVLIIGSAPDAVKATDWEKANFSHIIAINNAWRIRKDWDFCIHPEDLPDDNKPSSLSHHQSIITASDYVKVQNSFGGFVYAGGTMAFTAAYWALGALKPDVIGFIGCDMIYTTNGEATHFYGTGQADPLRQDVTLQSLEAKSNRLFYNAHEQGCVCLNFSSLNQTRLTFPKLDFEKLAVINVEKLEYYFKHYSGNLNDEIIDQAQKVESDLGYYFSSGRYWEHLDEICATKLLQLDKLWAKCFGHQNLYNSVTK